MKVAIEVPDFLMSDGVAAVVYFLSCNLKCKYCDFKKMIKLKDLKVIEFDELFDELVNIFDFVDNVVITGGEPLMYKDCVLKVLNFCSERDKKVWLYTNLSYDVDDVLEYVEKVVVDVKGSSLHDIMYNCGCDMRCALSILKNYVKYCENDRFIFRVSNDMNVSNLKFKNIEVCNRVEL